MRLSPAAGGGSFQLSCPGGGASASCRAALSLSSREGILVTVLLHGWAALHYLLGAIGLDEQMSQGPDYRVISRSEAQPP